MSSDISHRLPLTGEGRSLGRQDFRGKGSSPYQYIDTTGKAIECSTTLLLTVKLCSRLFILDCRSRTKYDRPRHFDPHFEEVGGGVEPWWMACWKARAEFLLSVSELLFLSLTVEALQGKTCQNSQPSEMGRSL